MKFFKKIKTNGTRIYYLFEIVPFLNIKTYNKTCKIKFFGIPII